MKTPDGLFEAIRADAEAQLEYARRVDLSFFIDGSVFGEHYGGLGKFPNRRANRQAEQVVMIANRLLGPEATAMWRRRKRILK